MQHIIHRHGETAQQRSQRCQQGDVVDPLPIRIGSRAYTGGDTKEALRQLPGVSVRTNGDRVVFLFDPSQVAPTSRTLSPVPLDYATDGFSPMQDGFSPVQQGYVIVT